MNKTKAVSDLKHAHPPGPHKANGPAQKPAEVASAAQRSGTLAQMAHTHPQSMIDSHRGASSSRAALSKTLQRSVGNSRISRMTVGPPNDTFEREADRVATQVMRMPGHQPGSVRKPPLEGEESGNQKRHTSIQRKSSSSESPALGVETENQIATMRGGGQPLSDSVRRFMEPRFGERFNDVRVHTSPEAAHTTRDLNARAYTVGRDIAFGAGQYSPESADGKALLAHELTHVVQQRGDPGTSGMTKMDVTDGQTHSISRSENDSVQRQPQGSNSPAPAPGVTPPTAPPPTGTLAAAPPPSGPVMSQGPIGDVVIPIGDWTFFESQSTTKEWKKDIGKTTLLTVPIPDLLADVDILASGGAHATFTASVGPGVLRNMRVGVSTSDYYESLWPDDVLLLPLLGPSKQLWVLRHDLDKFRALADLDIRAHIGVDLGAYGSIEAAATALELFKVASVALGFNANASAGADLFFGGPIGLYYEDDRLTFHFSAALEAQLNLAFTLMATVEATLLGFRWADSWVLINKDLGKTWRVGAPLDVDYDNDPKVSMATNEDDLAILPILKDLFGAVAGMQAKEEIQGPAPGGPEMPVKDAHDQSIAASRNPELLKGHRGFAPGKAGRNFTPGERDSVDDIGYATGDHSSGVMDPGTKTIDPRTKAGKHGKPNWIPDHQPPDTLQEGGAKLAFHFYPHSLSSAQAQGGTVLAYKKSMKKLRNRGDNNWSEGVQSDWFW